MASNQKSNEITIKRIYDAPVSRVWEAWSNPDQAAKWWGPRGFSITTQSKDLRVGGHWAYIMHGPDGTNYPNRTTYLEVDTHKRLVYDHGANDDQPPMFRVSVLFHDLKGKTGMEMTMILPTPEAAEQTRIFVKKAGGDSTWDRLAEYLEKEQKGKEIFVINRSFNTDRETLFKAWTEPEKLTAWSGPKGAQIEYLIADIKTDGKAFYRMPFGDTVMYGNVQYLEVARPVRLVYVQQFADEKGNSARHPLAPTWPQSMLTTITLSEEETNLTRVTLQWEVTGEWTPVELKTFTENRSNMAQGWGGSFDKLEDYLAGKPVS